MLDFTEWILLFSVILICFTLLIVGLSIIPMCRCFKKNNEKSNYVASWSRMTIPHHDAFSVAVPPLPPFLFVNGIGYDKMSTIV